MEILNVPRTLNKVRSEYGKILRRRYKNDIGVPYQLAKGYEVNTSGVCNCVTTFTTDNNIIRLNPNRMETTLTYKEHPTKQDLLEYFSKRIRIRKMTPDEAGKLMGLTHNELEKIKAHDAIHEEYAGRNLNDLTKVDWTAWHESIGKPHIDLLFASTPCQSVSNAGKNEGMKKGTDAESALIWATEDCIRALNPDIVMYENVKGMISKKNLPDFLEWVATLESLGYVVQWQVLNSKDFGIAQNRERVFPIAIRKGLPMAGRYVYPKGFPLTKCVEDYMEEDVDESYFIDQKRITEKVLSDILDHPNVRSEMEKTYHEEWKQTDSD